MDLQQLKCWFVRNNPNKGASRKCILVVLMKFYCPLFPRIVGGEPTVTFRTKQEQNFRRNEQAGGRAYVPRLTAPFNNMRTPKFKAQLTNAFFAAVNQIFGGSSQLPTPAERCSYHEAFHETFYSSRPVQAYSHRIKN